MSRSTTKAAILSSALVAIFVPLFVSLDGYDLANIHVGVVTTARTAFVLFLIVYFARPLRDLTGVKGLLRYRRTLGLCVAIAMTVHYGFLFAFFHLSDEAVLDNMPRFVTGMLGVLSLYAMTFTSNNASVRVLGPWWQRIHSFGIHYLWFFFFVSFVLGVERLTEAGNPRVTMLYGFMAIMLAGLLARLVLFVRRRVSKSAS